MSAHLIRMSSGLLLDTGLLLLDPTKEASPKSCKEAPSICQILVFWVIIKLLHTSFSITGLILRSSIHLDLGFVQGDRCGLLSFFCMQTFSFLFLFPHHFERCCLQGVSSVGTCLVYEAWFKPNTPLAHLPKK